MSSKEPSDKYHVFQLCFPLDDRLLSSDEAMHLLHPVFQTHAATLKHHPLGSFSHRRAVIMPKRKLDCCDLRWRDARVFKVLDSLPTAAICIPLLIPQLVFPRWHSFLLDGVSYRVCSAPGSDFFDRSSHLTEVLQSSVLARRTW